MKISNENPGGLPRLSLASLAQRAENPELVEPLAHWSFDEQADLLQRRENRLRVRLERQLDLI